MLALSSLLAFPSAVGSYGIALTGLTALTMAACGGGGDDSAPTVPLLAWPRERRSDANTAVSSVDIGENEGRAGLAYEFGDDQTPTGKSPIIGRDSFVYVGLAEGLLSLKEPDNAQEDAIDLDERWELSTCGTVPLGSVSSLAISPDGRDIIVGSADDSSQGGVVARLRETEDGEGEPECRFTFPIGSRSTALISVDAIDLELLSIALGTTSGRLTSLNSVGARRWSFPENEPFAGSISSSPAVLSGGFVFASPDGRLHSVDQSGRARWTTVIGGAYPDNETVPSPAVLNQIFTVNAAGDVVAFTPNGAQLWTFSPDEGRDIVGSLAVSLLSTEGGAFLGENVVFALDRQGTAYGIGSLTGELIRFCEYDNRACLPSNCEDEADCRDELMRCSETTEQPCGAPDDRPCPDGESCINQFLRCSETTEQVCGGPSDQPCPDGESCTEQFRCVNDPSRACFRDFCIMGDDDGQNPDDRSDGLCKREAKMPLTSGAAEFATAPTVTIDGFVVATTTDGRVCARRLDGGIPNGTCPESGDPCTPDSCAGEDTCCGPGDTRPDDTPCTPGHCIADPTRACSLDTCLRDDEGEECGVNDGENANWIDGDGCVELGATGATTVSPPIIGSNGEIIVTTDIGLAMVK